MSDRERSSSEELIKRARQRIEAERVDEDEATSEIGGGTVKVPQDLRHDARRTGETLVSPEELIVSDSPAPQPSRTTSFGVTTVTRLVIGGLIFGGWLLFTSFDDANRDGSGEIVGGGDLDVATLQPGDCFDAPDSDVVFDVQAVPCSEAHDNEVFAVGSVGSTFGENWPGLTALDDHAYEACTGSQFATYVGTSYVESSLGVFTLTPTDESWEEGDRGFICAIYSLDFAPLTRSVRDSGL